MLSLDEALTATTLSQFWDEDNKTPTPTPIPCAHARVLTDSKTDPLHRQANRGSSKDHQGLLPRSSIHGKDFKQPLT